VTRGVLYASLFILGSYVLDNGYPTERSLECLSHAVIFISHILIEGEMGDIDIDIDVDVHLGM
jgi:hypothetical protein